jgi:hypothetical protein
MTCDVSEITARPNPKLYKSSQVLSKIAYLAMVWGRHTPAALKGAANEYYGSAAEAGARTLWAHIPLD